MTLCAHTKLIRSIVIVIIIIIWKLLLKNIRINILSSIFNVFFFCQKLIFLKTCKFVLILMSIPTWKHYFHIVYAKSGVDWSIMDAVYVRGKFRHLGWGRSLKIRKNKNFLIFRPPRLSNHVSTPSSAALTRNVQKPSRNPLTPEGFFEHCFLD